MLPTGCGEELPAVTKAGKFQVSPARQWQRSRIWNSCRRFSGNQRQYLKPPCSSSDPLALRHNQRPHSSLSQPSLWRPWWKSQAGCLDTRIIQSFLVCLGSQPHMTPRKAAPIQIGMASTQENSSSSALECVCHPATDLPAGDPIALIPRKHLTLTAYLQHPAQSLKGIGDGEDAWSMQKPWVRHLPRKLNMSQPTFPIRTSPGSGT